MRPTTNLGQCCSPLSESALKDLVSHDELNQSNSYRTLISSCMLYLYCVVTACQITLQTLSLVLCPATQLHDDRTEFPLRSYCYAVIYLCCKYYCSSKLPSANMIKIMYHDNNYVMPTVSACPCVQLLTKVQWYSQLSYIHICTMSCIILVQLLITHEVYIVFQSPPPIPYSALK